MSELMKDPIVAVAVITMIQTVLLELLRIRGVQASRKHRKEKDNA